MKVLNLYAGIGGNRKLWQDVEVTALEIEPEIAQIYKDHFPGDDVIVGDAHTYLEKHYDDGWDFIWASTPCPTHGKIRNIAGVGKGQVPPVYPDMRLYQEIIFLNQIEHTSGASFSGKWVVENVISYYDPLILPQKVSRHYFWANFVIPQIRADRKHNATIAELEKQRGFDLSAYSIKTTRKDTTLRNCVNPKLGLHILDCARSEQQSTIKQWDQ